MSASDGSDQSPDAHEATSESEESSDDHSRSKDDRPLQRKRDLRRGRQRDQGKYLVYLERSAARKGFYSADAYNRFRKMMITYKDAMNADDARRFASIESRSERRNQIQQFLEERYPGSVPARKKAVRKDSHLSIARAHGFDDVNAYYRYSHYCRKVNLSAEDARKIALIANPAERISELTKLKDELKKSRRMGNSINKGKHNAVDSGDDGHSSAREESDEEGNSELSSQLIASDDGKHDRERKRPRVHNSENPESHEDSVEDDGDESVFTDSAFDDEEDIDEEDDAADDSEGDDEHGADDIIAPDHVSDKSSHTQNSAERNDCLTDNEQMNPATYISNIATSDCTPADESVEENHDSGEHTNPNEGDEINPPLSPAVIASVVVKSELSSVASTLIPSHPPLSVSSKAKLSSKKVHRSPPLSSNLAAK
jgi:hypothetical protein